MVFLFPILSPPHVLLYLLHILLPLTLSTSSSPGKSSCPLCDVSLPHHCVFPRGFWLSPTPRPLGTITENSEWLYGATQTLTHDGAYCRSSSLALICSIIILCFLQELQLTNVSCIINQSANCFRICDIVKCLVLSVSPQRIVGFLLKSSCS